jgi:predicted transcriptional regulator of viral defense system
VCYHTFEANRAVAKHILHSEHNAPGKTIGPRTAQLTAALYDRGRTTFTFADVEEITRLRPASARSLLRNATARGLVSRLEPGLFVLVPPELGSATEFSGNPYITARELVGGCDYYISYGSAMELHRMLTQPQFVVYTCTTKRLRPRTILGTEFRFVRQTLESLFGIADHWVTKQETVKISDVDRTIIDGLKHPEYCGGVTEVAKALWIRRADVQPARLVNYALRLGVGAVTRRLGYLLETYGIGGRADVGRLRTALTTTYVLFDPLMPREGAYQSRWRLRLNIPVEELTAVRDA